MTPSQRLAKIKNQASEPIVGDELTAEQAQDIALLFLQAKGKAETQPAEDAALVATVYSREQLEEEDDEWSEDEEDAYWAAAWVKAFKIMRASKAIITQLGRRGQLGENAKWGRVIIERIDAFIGQYEEEKKWEGETKHDTV